MNETLNRYTWDDVEIDEDSKFSHNKSSFSITKADSDKRLVFGWALVSARSDGEQIIDSQGDIVEQDDLEEGAYEYVLNFRDAGEEHVGSLRKKARMVESVVFTEEKMRAMGIPAGTVPVGWWIGFYVDDDRTWELIKNGTYKMFSIEGKALREPVKEPITKRVAKAFSEVFKYNDRHDPATGRFAHKGGGVAIATTAAQQYTSAETSINSSKLPAVFGKVDWKPGTVNFDNGGGKFDNATEYLETKGVKNLIYDPYNRSPEHNNSVIDKISRQKADTATISNVLNVIQEKEARLEVLRNTKAALKDGGTAYITIYEGNGSGIGKPSSKGYQLNMKTKDYLSEVQEVFPNSYIQRGMIVANNSPATNTFTQVVDRRTRTAKSFYEIEKFNAYHDSRGRFSTAEGAASFTYRPGVSRAHDLAIEREKKRHEAGLNNPKYTVKPREETPRVKSILKIEKRIQNQNFESAAIVDKDGNEILFKDGQRDYVAFTQAECANMVGTTMTHNHPRCSMFSEEDLSFMVNNNLYEIRATNRDGTTYSMKKSESGIDYGKVKGFISDYADEYLNGIRYAQNDLDKRGYSDKIRRGEITTDEANQEFGRTIAKHMVDWTNKTASNYGLVFTVENSAAASAYATKSWSGNVMKADEKYILDRDTNTLEDSAFNQWLEENGLISKTAKSFEDLMKFNPYHDSKGRFTTANGYASFTVRTKDPKKQHMADMAVAREKEKAANQNKEKEPRRIVLNQRNKELANNWSFMSDKGGYYERAANEELDSFRSKFKRDDLTDEQKKFLDQREEEYAKLITDQYNDLLYRQGTNPSSMVAGPANFNTRRFERKQQAEINSQNEFNEKKKRFTENTEKQLKGMEPEEKQIAYWRNGRWKHGETISTDDPLAEKKLTAKLEYQKEEHQKMKDANAYYRKNGTMEGFEGFSEKTNQNINRQMQDTRFGRQTQPFASYSLTNNNQQIKATESRLKQIQQLKATSSSSGGGGGGSSFNGGQIIRNTDMNRLQIKFDGIPDAATRQQLKSNGWRWSPKNGVWQRQLTANAEASAKRITDELNKSYDYEVAKTFSDIVKFNPYHDSKGRFSSADGSASFTYAPGKSKAHDLAIAREKERFAAGAASKDSKEQAERRVSEAERNLKSLLNDDAEVKLTGMDPDLAESTVKSVQMVLDRYPTVKDAFGGFTTDDLETGGFSAEGKEGVMALYNTSTQKIHLNKKYYSNKEFFEERYNASVERKSSPQGTTLDSVVVHEMGHAIDRYVSIKTMDTFKVNYGIDSASTRFWNNDIKNARKKGEPLTGKSITEGLSRYATKNHSEYFAEGFSEYMTSPNPRPIAQSLGKRMETYIKKAAKSG